MSVDQCLYYILVNYFSEHGAVKATGKVLIMIFKTVFNTFGVMEIFLVFHLRHFLARWI